MLKIPEDQRNAKGRWRKLKERETEAATKERTSRLFDDDDVAGPSGSKKARRD